MREKKQCLYLLLLMLLGLVTEASQVGGLEEEVKRENVSMVPLGGENDMRFGMIMEEKRRKLGGFHICALCTCCGGPKGLCLPSPCCYAINCNIPNRPFGFCSFTPKTCNCFGCHL
ncbi:hypothetical protein AMTRI_Chr06g194890 [Amborella trichopoda]|uniref:DUF7866 domain-containing protein n=1 Tax=Amborella trichopoda TaxID=13333 RepID=W1PPP4_AMBTC|nr:uncharacterized protein LOC18438210 [Amborella trichopoda]ERN10043.1 hypothetical protein AMTR_s00013p00249900 [Amborella trichopoda]|eukprot:XP_006848462.1 uncharacterized protein LOC18438210 [Amborella trichopoda]